MNTNTVRESGKFRHSVIRSTMLALLGIAACGVASAASIQVESAYGTFIAEAMPTGEGYQYTWSVTPNLALDYNGSDAVSGRCLTGSGSHGTVFVTVTYPNGHMESAQRGVSCGLPGWPNNY